MAEMTLPLWSEIAGSDPRVRAQEAADLCREAPARWLTSTGGPEGIGTVEHGRGAAGIWEALRRMVGTGEGHGTRDRGG